MKSKSATNLLANCKETAQNLLLSFFGAKKVKFSRTKVNEVITGMYLGGAIQKI